MISVITPTVRPEYIPILEKCLSRQTFKDFEWLIGSPLNIEIKNAKYIPDPPKKEGDYYGLNKSWNALFKASKGELIVNITDGLWFPPDTLEKLWQHYYNDPKSCISCIGHQYDRLENGKPEHLVWQDPRARIDQGSYYEVEATEMELCLGSFPRQAVLDVGGIDEKYDKGAALGEKEMFIRIQRSGYKLYLDQSIEYRAISHPRLSTEWDDKYKIATEMYLEDIKDIISGKRLRLDYL